MNKTIFEINLILLCIAVCLFNLSGAISTGNGKNQPSLDSGDYTPLKPTYDHDPEAKDETPLRVQEPGANGFLYPNGRITKPGDADNTNFVQEDDVPYQPRFMPPPNMQDWKRNPLNRIPPFEYHPVNRWPVENVPTGGFSRFQVNNDPNFNMDPFSPGGEQSYRWNSGFQQESFTGPDGITRHRTINW